PFLCAIYRSSGRNRSDFHFGEVLAMPHLALEALAALELEDDELLAATVLYDLGLDLGALHERLPDRGGVSEYGEHFLENHGLSGLTHEGGDAEGIALRHAELLSAAAKDCARHWGAGI